MKLNQTLQLFEFGISSFENESSKSRHAYSLHVVDTDGCKWADGNWWGMEFCFVSTELELIIRKREWKMAPPQLILYMFCYMYICRIRRKIEPEPLYISWMDDAGLSSCAVIFRNKYNVSANPSIKL